MDYLFKYLKFFVYFTNLIKNLIASSSIPNLIDYTFKY
jgi:hypothetical protein